MSLCRRFATTIFAALVSAALAASSATMRVTGDRVNLRALPDGESEIVGQVSAGEHLVAPEGVAAGAPWVKVRPPDTVDLWIYAPLVKDGVVVADGTYVRPGPGLQFRAVGRLQKGTELTLRGTAAGDWLRIAPVAGTCEVWISSAYVKEEKDEVGEASPQDEADGGPGEAALPPPATQGAAPPVPVEEASAVDVAAPAEEEPVAEAAPSASVEEAPAVEATAPAEEGCGEAPPRRLLPAESESPAVRPYALAGQVLDPRRPQGTPAVICGRIDPIPFATAPSFARYQLLEAAGPARKSAICRIIGLSGQWSELAGSEVEVSGRLWNIAGDPCPILEALRADRIASWEK